MRTPQIPQTATVRPSAREPRSVGPAHELRSDGWTRVSKLIDGARLAPLKTEISTLFAAQAPDVDPWAPQSTRVGESARASIHRCLRYLPGLMRLAVDPDVLDLVQHLGIREPAVMQSHDVRMDGPGDDAHLSRWHQDFTCLLGSPNTVTLWIPLTRADALRGSIRVVPATHRNGVLPVTPTNTRHTRPDAALSGADLVMNDPPADDAGFIVEADPGDVIAFSGLTVHRSTPNLSDRIRFTAQLRYADLASPGFKQAGYPFGDATNIYHAGYRGTFYDPSR